MTDDSAPRPKRLAKVGGDGEVEVFAADEQADVPIELERWRTLATDVLVDLGVRGAAELSILFVTVEEITELNEEYMDTVGPTDVLAFPIDATDVEPASGPGALSRGPSRAEPDVSDLPLLLGDVVVCPAVAAAQAPEHAGTLDDELALLVVHGILHVMGHDHAEADQAERMRAEELRLLSAHHWHGPPPEGFRQEHRS
jgi:probable rRNA maturation factor